jgi:hypothetical protein
MRHFEGDRKTYPNLADFMPRVVEFFNAQAAAAAQPAAKKAAGQ